MDESTNSAQTPDANQMPGERIVIMVNKAVASIMARLQSLASFEGGESKVTTLVAAATSDDNLCRMDPAYYPWL